MIESLFSEKYSCLSSMSPLSRNSFDVLRFPHADGISVFHLHDLVFNLSQRHVSVFHLSCLAKIQMTLSTCFGHIKQNRKTQSLHFIAEAKCRRVNDFGITLWENHFECGTGSNSSISFDLRCGGEEDGLGNISYHGIVIPASRRYNAHAMSTSIIEWFHWPNFGLAAL